MSSFLLWTFFSDTDYILLKTESWKHLMFISKLCKLYQFHSWFLSLSIHLRRLSTNRWVWHCMFFHCHLRRTPVPCHICCEADHSQITEPRSAPSIASNFMLPGSRDPADALSTWPDQRVRTQRNSKGSLEINNLKLCMNDTHAGANVKITRLPST